MSHAVWTPLAEAELEDIVYYIAVKDRRPLTAERIARGIHNRAENAADKSAIWRKHPDLPPDWFYVLHKRWVIVFMKHPVGIEVLRVIDASRDFTRLFGGLSD
ncbi:MAG: type II toxin-antitoxin system RelE/ParE family toxin [Planctomycetes bacterium]|nr:type II toxin-antitoxin system RelE/ParE family toxin [Planctomycetota bacterium]